MDRWFCNRCKSLNARGAKRCYSCGARYNDLGFDLPETGSTAPGSPARSGAPAASVEPLLRVPDAEVLGFTNGRGGNVRRGRSLAAIVFGGVVLVAIIGSVAVLGVGGGPNAAAATALPSRSPRASAVAIRSPGTPVPSASARPQPSSGGGGAAPMLVLP